MSDGGAPDPATYARKSQVLLLAEPIMILLWENIVEFDRADRSDAAKYRWLKTSAPPLLKFLDEMDRA